MHRASQNLFSQNGSSFKNDQSVCLLSDLHYKLIMNQRPKKGKTEALGCLMGNYLCQE